MKKNRENFYGEGNKAEKKNLRRKKEKTTQ